MEINHHFRKSGTDNQTSKLYMVNTEVNKIYPKIQSSDVRSQLAKLDMEY